MISYNKKSWFVNLKYSLIDWFNKNKLFIIIIGSLLLIGLLTGVFTAVKLYNLDKDLDFSHYSMYSLVENTVFSFKFFLSRFLSVFLSVLLLLLASIKGFLRPLGVLLLIYRTFLVGLNCVFIIIKTGLGGIFISLIIILPCHLLLIGILALIFMYFISMFKQKSNCGKILYDYKKDLLFFIALLIVVCFVEFLFLLIFKPTTLLVI